MIYQTCDVMMSISIWDRVHGIYLLNHNALTHQTWPIDRYKQGKYFSEVFWAIWRTGEMFQSLFNLATYSNYSITNHVNFPVIVRKGISTSHISKLSPPLLRSPPPPPIPFLKISHPPTLLANWSSQVFLINRMQLWN